MRKERLREAQCWSVDSLPQPCSFRCYLCKSALPSSAEMPTWGGGAESLCSCAWLPRAVGGGWRPQHPGLPGASWLGSQPCGVRAAAHQPAPWHQARDASQPGEEAAWLAANSQCLSCQLGGRPGRAETPAPERGPGQATRTGPSFSLPPQLQGGCVDPAQSNLTGWGPRRAHPHLFSSAFHYCGSSTWSRGNFQVK